MDRRTIKWNRTAYLQMVYIAAWYRENVGAKAANSFISSIMHVLEQISLCPTMGMLDRKNSNARFEYRSFLIHPKYRIVYRLTKSTIRIVTIHCNLMNT